MCGSGFHTAKPFTRGNNYGRRHLVTVQMSQHWSQLFCLSSTLQDRPVKKRWALGRRAETHKEEAGSVCDLHLALDRWRMKVCVCVRVYLTRHELLL